MRQTGAWEKRISKHNLDQGVSVDADTNVGAGAVVSEDVPSWAVVMGCPGRVVRILAENERGGR
jgi:acetyltransferase-like isoleucine patch superfamily enzyme